MNPYDPSGDAKGRLVCEGWAPSSSLPFFHIPTHHKWRTAPLPLTFLSADTLVTHTAHCSRWWSVFYFCRLKHHSKKDTTLSSWTTWNQLDNTSTHTLLPWCLPCTLAVQIKNQNRFTHCYESIWRQIKYYCYCGIPHLKVGQAQGIVE